MTAPHYLAHLAYIPAQSDRPACYECTSPDPLSGGTLLIQATKAQDGIRIDIWCNGIDSRPHISGIIQPPSGTIAHTATGREYRAEIRRAQDAIDLQLWRIPDPEAAEIPF